MRRILIVATLVAGSLLAGTHSASAAEPNNQACLGKDFSGYAKAFQPFGQTLTTFAPTGTPIIEGGLGAEVQGHLAGLVPDSVLPNSCNN